MMEPTTNKLISAKDSCDKSGDQKATQPRNQKDVEPQKSKRGFSGRNATLARDFSRQVLAGKAGKTAPVEDRLV